MNLQFDVEDRPKFGQMTIFALQQLLAIMAATIAVLSLKGGTGKTTTVRTLADAFERAGLKVLSIDLDPQGNLSDYFDVPGDATPTVADVLSGDAKAKGRPSDDRDKMENAAARTQEESGEGQPS